MNLSWALVCLVLIGVLVYSSASRADDLITRSITIGTSVPSAVTTHDFNFTIPGATSIGSIEFEYCSNDPFIDTPCTVPAGLDVSGATLTTEAGEVGFSIDPTTTANKLVLSRLPSVTAGGPARYLFSNIVNPSTANSSTYVRMTTYASTDASGSFTDGGSIVFSTSGQLNVTAFVPPYLRFCVGVTVAVDCTANGDFLSMGTLTSTATRAVTSQMAASTNSPTGYSITMLGTTMTSGNNVIQASATPTVSVPGREQFGVNLRANSQPPVGQDAQGLGTGSAANGYDVPNRFKFVSGEVVAASPLPTNINIHTVSYIANIVKDQPVGVYVSTITYIATAQF